MTREEAITQLRGRVQALLTLVRSNHDGRKQQRWPRATQLWPNSRIVRELEDAMLDLELPGMPQAARGEQREAQ